MTQGEFVSVLEQMLGRRFEVTYNGIDFKYRPITWNEEMDIQRISQREGTDEERLRSRLLWTVFKGLVSPKPNGIDEVQKIPFGIIAKLAMAINNVSSGEETKN